MRGWTGKPRGHAMWQTPELRAAALAKRNRPLPERLAKFTERRGSDECWPWTGSTNGVGYGKLTINKRQRLATHVALEVDGRPQPLDESFACHRCDNPGCVNPAHLFWGTPSDNTMDGYRKGRILTPTERRALGAPFVTREGL